MSVDCRTITKRIEDKYPLANCEDYDNSGLIIGKYNKIINKVLVCLDVTENICNEAIENHVDMIISHHPIIFNSLKKITDEDKKGSIIMSLLKNDICVYALHTNFDSSIDGMNDLICEKLKLINIGTLVNNKPIKLYKFVVFVPFDYKDKVKDAILNAGAGYIGKYSHCSFITDGIGTFLAHENCNPFIGEIGNIENTKEVRIETIIEENNLENIIEIMKSVHPYEEPVYDVYPIKLSQPNGIGRCGYVNSETTLQKFCEYVKEKLNIPYVDVTGDLNKKIKKVAIVGGSGMEFLYDACNKGCQVMITGDVKHHQAIDALEKGITIINGSHYYTEICFNDYICNYLMDNFDIIAFAAKSNTNPFKRV